jgi:hypothetical protein
MPDTLLRLVVTISRNSARFESGRDAYHALLSAQRLASFHERNNSKWRQLDAGARRKHPGMR